MLAGFDLIGDISHHLAIDADIAGREVDVTLRCQMDAAQVQNELTVDQNPDVIVAGEMEVHIIAVEVLIAAAAHSIGKVESDIIPHTEPPVDSRHTVVCGVLGFVGIIGFACIIAGIVAPYSGGNVARRIGIGGVQRQEVRILIVIGGVRRKSQIVINIEPLGTLIVGRRVQSRVVIVIAVGFASGVRIKLEQVIALSQVMLAHSGGVRSEQQLNQLITSAFDDTGVNRCTTCPDVFTLTLFAASRGIAKVSGVPIFAVIFFNEGEVHCGTHNRVAAIHMAPALGMAVGIHGHIDTGGMQIDQGAVVKDMGRDKVIGAYRIHHMGIILTNVIGRRNPVGIQHRIFRNSDLSTGSIVGTG